MFDVIVRDLSFEAALAIIKDRPKMAMRLPHWNPATRIRVQRPSVGSSIRPSKMTAPYLYVTSARGMVPWIPTYPEMFSEVWQICVQSESEV